MEENSYDTIDEFRGTVSQKHVTDLFGFERAQLHGPIARAGSKPQNAKLIRTKKGGPKRSRPFCLL